MPSPVVTVAVVSWNTLDRLRTCLSSLAADVEAGRARVVVVDNASSDGSAAMARSEFPWARVISAGANLGFGPAVNLAASAGARTPWLACANADVAVSEGALAALIAAGERGPRTGIVAPRLVGDDGGAQRSVHPFPTLRFTLAFNLGLARPDASDWAVGAFLLIRRAAFERVGGFDERQWMYAEDLDLGWRLARAGWQLCHEPDAVVRHAGAASTEQAWADAEERWLRSTYAWMLRRRGAVATRSYGLVSVLGAAARMDRRWVALHLRELVASRSVLARHR